MNKVRLCFQTFIQDAQGKYTVPLQPVVSNVIYDKKAATQLHIVELGDSACPVDGGKKNIILLCEKVKDLVSR